MAHFYGTCNGRAKTYATRCGTKSSGLVSTASGWDIGGHIEVNYNKETDSDVVSLYITRGSSGHSRLKLASITLVNGKLTMLDTQFPELAI